jgi:hypothetical protein
MRLENVNLTPDDIAEWLETWVVERLEFSRDGKPDSDVEAEAEQCSADAAKAGIGEVDLIVAAGGDLEAYLSARQSAIKNAH